MTAANAIQTEETTAVRAFPVSIDSLDPSILAMDLYLKRGGPNSFVLYRSVGVEFSADDRHRLLEQGLRFLYVPFSQHAVYREVLLNQLERKFDDPETSRAERVQTIRTACGKMIEDVLLFPSQPETVDAVADISRRFAAWSARNHREFGYLLDMSTHDYYTVTHMVNVGVGCGLLSKELRPGDEELQATFIQGGILHDIGKRIVPEDILNKSSRPSPEEWELIKRHPESGFAELNANPEVPAAVLEMVRDHHERPDGAGYARGLARQQVGFAARLCAVVDVYDAICSARSYRPATPPADALYTMRSGAGTQFDPHILSAWATKVERLLEQDPGRAPRGTGGGTTLNMGNLLPESGLQEMLDANAARGIAQALNSDERRRHPRFSCRLTIYATFIRQGKQGHVPDGQRIPVKLSDVSRGGLQLRTNWPLSMNDLLEVELPVGQGAVVHRRARVVRVRRARDGDWLSGLCFVPDKHVDHTV